VAFLLVPYLLSTLGEDGYGVIGIVNSVLGLVVLIELGIRPAATREFARFLYEGETGRSNELASAAMAAYLVVATLILIGVSLFAGRLLDGFQVPEYLLSDGSAALILAAVSLGFMLLATPYTAALASQLRYDVQHYMTIFDALFRGAFIVLAFSIWEPRLFLWALASLLAGAVVLGVTQRRAHTICPSLVLHRGLVSRRALRDLASSGVYTSIARSADWLTLQSGSLVVGYYLGASLVAHYTPAVLLATTLQMLSGGFLLQLQPVVIKASVDAELGLIRRLLLRSTRYTLLSSGAAAVWAACLSPLIVACWLGHGFEDTALVLLLWCGTVLLHACVGGAFPVFLGTGNFRFVAVLNGGLAAGSLAVGVWLVGVAGWGVVGFAVAIVAAQLVRTVIWIRMSARIAGVAWRDYLRESYAGPLVCLSAMAATSLGLQRLLALGPWEELAFAGGAALLVFATVAWGIGLNAQDRAKVVDYARQAWRKVAARVVRSQRKL
jgi:O-antigen/teichoic acid export membrane protein